MTIFSVFDPEFKPYGKVITGMEETVAEILDGLEQTPLPEGTGYVPTEPDRKSTRLNSSHWS